MLIRLLKYLKGYVHIRVEGYSPERFLNLCSHHDILLWGIENKGNAYEMFVSVAGFRRLKPLVKKTKTRLVIQDKHGLPFFLHKYRKRKMFFIGVVLCICMIFLLSRFIWNIHIDGNYSRTTGVILDYLDEKGVYHGIPKNDVDCEKIETDIRKQFNDIIWASAEISGTRLIIKVKENTDTNLNKEQKKTGHLDPTDLNANKNALITKIITRAGVPAVKEGDVVKKGDLLVSGRVEVLDDNGEVGAYQYCAADSDIYAKTYYSYKEQFSMKHTIKTYTGKEKKKLHVKLFNRIFSLGFGKISYEHHDRITSEKQLKLGESFYLPISIGNDVYREYETKEVFYTEKEAKALAAQKLDEYLKTLEKKGIKIEKNEVTITADKETCKAEGRIQVTEKIGVRAPTEILEVPSKDEKSEEEQ